MRRRLSNRIELRRLLREVAATSAVGERVEQAKTIARTTFDFSDPKKIHLIEDRSVDGGPFVVFGDMTQK